MTSGVSIPTGAAEHTRSCCLGTSPASKESTQCSNDCNGGQANHRLVEFSCEPLLDELLVHSGIVLCIERGGVTGQHEEGEVEGV